MRKNLFVVLSVVLGLAACSKSDDPPTPYQHLTTGKWRLTAWTTSATIPFVGTQQVNQFDTLAACTKDNTFQFQTGGKLAYDEEATKCNSAAPQTAAVGSWALLEGDKKFRLTLAISALPGLSPLAAQGADSVTLSGDVLELTAQSLRIKATGNYMIQTFSIPYEINQSFVKQ